MNIWQCLQNWPKFCCCFSSCNLFQLEFGNMSIWIQNSIKWGVMLQNYTDYNIRIMFKKMSRHASDFWTVSWQLQSLFHAFGGKEVKPHAVFLKFPLYYCYSRKKVVFAKTKAVSFMLAHVSMLCKMLRIIEQSYNLILSKFLTYVFNNAVESR